MANNLQRHTWIIDSPGPTVLYKSTVFIKSIYWKGPTTIGHSAVLQDQHGNEFATLVCEVNNESQYFLKDVQAQDGLIVPTLASGVLYIDIK